MSREISSDIDFVITWVDGSDREWLEQKAKYRPEMDIDDTAARYRDFNTLKYLLRSIEKFAPWVRNVYLITSGHIPSWLSLGHPKLKLVKHSDYIPEEYLPTFSSHPIEWNMHKIEGLSENFVYFNDDMLFTAPVEPTDFFKKGLPCDEFGLGMVRPVEYFSHIPFNHMLVLNEHFTLPRVLKEQRKKIFRLKYGKRLLKTLVLSRLGIFYGVHDHHLGIAFHKSYFDMVWNEHYDLIDKTCKNKFRSKEDVSIWLVRYYQLLTGHFEPRSTKFGKFFIINDFVKIKHIKKLLQKGKYKMICVNDNSACLDGFEQIRDCFAEIMDVILADKSTYEL